MKIGRNDPCWCGSAKKYKKCHLDIDADMRPVIAQGIPIVMAKQAAAQEYDRRLRDEFGLYRRILSPIVWQGRKVWAMRNRVYLNQPPNQTFHEFIVMVLLRTLGEDWRDAQQSLPEDERHFVYRCYEQFQDFKIAHGDPDEIAERGYTSAEMNGWVRYLLSLAWDIAALNYAGEPPDELISRLRDRTQYQGARYELAVAATFARLGCSIRWLDADPSLGSGKRVEFEATFEPTGNKVAVEAKSRTRPGVLNEPEDPGREDLLANDRRGVRQLFNKARKKAGSVPPAMPYLIFIDVNAPSDRDQDWQAETQGWLAEMPASSANDPAEFTALYLTNFSPHYDADDVSIGGSWAFVAPQFPREAVDAELARRLHGALRVYGRVPSISSDDTLLD